MTETEIQTNIMLALSKYGIPIRINSGTAWGGKLVNGVVIHPRPIKLAPAGFADILFIGENGRVCFIECKTLTGRQREAQKRFQAAVENLGHKYYVCRSVDDVIKIFTNFYK